MPRIMPIQAVPLLAVPLLLFIALFSSRVSAVDQYGYRIIDQKVLAPHTFVQGLEILEGQLYISSGLYGKSLLRRIDFDTGVVEAERRLDPRLWAEGLTVMGNRVYQLTWRARLLLVYNKEDLAAVERMQIPGEGWGLTNNDEELIYSDGSDRLYFLSPAEHRITRAVNVREAGQPVHHLNELAWIDGRIWANVWRTDRIVIIDPADGKVEASINLQGLLPIVERQPDSDVLNGIARNPADNSIWVTGKNWPWLYRIELVPATAALPIPGTAVAAGEAESR